VEAKIKKEDEERAELERQEAEEVELRKKRHDEWVCMTISSLQFLRASAMLKHVIDIGCTSVCPSVRPSVCHTLALYQNG